MHKEEDALKQVEVILEDWMVSPISLNNGL